METPAALEHRIVDKTQGSRDIELFRLTNGPVNLLLMGGVHGDEPEGYYLVERFMQDGGWKLLEGKAALWCLPRLNPDGCALNTRTNLNKVDLNRNMATKDWSPVAAKERYHPGPAAASEIETRALVKVIDSLKPRAIVSMHTFDPMINYNGPCRKLAEVFAKGTGYIVTDHIGYPTPGSLGTWAGWEREIPTITLEIERDSGFEKTWRTHAQALLDGLLFAAENKDMA
jgi:protein MpaA